MQSFVHGGGELGALIREKDWSQTPLGPIESWPQSLKTALGIMLNSRYPMFVFWGPQLIKIYNDGYRPITGHKHPWALGRPATEVWPEIWDDIKPLVDRALAGDPTWSDDLMLFMQRSGFPEEVYFTFSYSPIPDESGGIGGMFCACTETTGEVLRERRLRTLRDLAAEPADAKSIADACTLSARALSTNTADIPFALMYLLDHEGTARLVAATGVAPDEDAAPRSFVASAVAPWPVHETAAARAPQLVSALADRFPSLPPGPWPEPPNAAMVLPLIDRGIGRGIGAVVLGVSARRPFDDEYREWFGLVSAQLSASVSNARAAEEERKRIEALAEIDRAKTAFFSNVSHEFRTPLTLMLSPIEERVRMTPPGESTEWLSQVYRNGRRLQKLVNSLLEFSRIEAGRLTAKLQPTNVGEFTADIASLFRSAIEKAGLRFRVEAPPSAEVAFIDREMWEKVVLNLLSNAFKFTHDGEIELTLEETPGDIRLRVRDTGVGIPAAETGRVFERFHRVETARGRTHEGTGIGLALTAELVRLHDGEIAVDSIEGKGSTFTVTVPRGHDAVERIPLVRAEPAAASATSQAFIEEALRWLPDEDTVPAAAIAAEPSGPSPAAAPTRTPGRVLIVDDNADMRAYLRRILGSRWTVDTAVNGRDALERVHDVTPDVIVADVMMPEVDGFALLQALRAEERTQRIPVILVSARAGEESRAEGIEKGADDYVVKPFAARELIARVETQLLRVQVRRMETQQRERLADVFRQAPAPIAILRGPDHVFEIANDAYLALVGHREVVGKPLRDAIPEIRNQGILDILDRVYGSGEPYVGRALRLMVDDERGVPKERYYDFIYQPLAEADGRITGIAAVVFDVTDLAQTKAAAEAGSRAKDEFLAMLGHELRNPLAPLMTAVQLLRLRGIDTVERECAIIERQLRHLTRMVDDLLDVSRVARGKVELRIEPIEMTEVIARAIEMALPAIEQQRHVLTLDVPQGGLAVNGDPARLAQVVANLLTNAAKYTDTGGTIHVRARAEAGEVIIEVTDSGQGIEPDLLPRVFDLFAQGPQSPDRARGGLGIGLALVKSLVDAHGGSVQASSAGLGTGSTFIVRLPATQAAPAREANAPGPLAVPQVGAGHRVLIVDDNADAAEMLDLFLGGSGFETRMAHDGIAALKAAAEFRPDVVVLDIGLPAMDGYEVAERLREDPSLRDIRLIALTGYGLDHDHQRSRKAGFDTHLVKPVDMSELLEVLGQTLKS